MKDIKLSIIIPVYNVDKYLPRCINSIIQQNCYCNYEIILIDDGSIDKSGHLCDEYAKQYNIIKVIHKTNGGVSSARNIGISRADGDYIWFVDSDDFVAANSLKVVCDAISSNKAEIYEFAFFRNLTKVSLAENLLFLNNNENVVRFFMKEPKFHLWNKIIRKSVIGNITFTPGIKIGEDFLFLSMVFNRNSSYLYIDTPIYEYFDNRENSAMTTLTENIKSENIKLIFMKIKEQRSFFSANNYAALPTVFLNKKLLIAYRSEISKTIINFIKCLSVGNIVNANCTKRQKLYLMIYKILSVFQ